MNDFRTAQISLQLAHQLPQNSLRPIAKTLTDANPSPFLFSFPHSGRHYSAEFSATSRLDPLKLRSSEDAFVDQLFTRIAAQGGNRLEAMFPRSYVDVNRLAIDLDPDLFYDPLPQDANIHAPLIKAGLGVIPRVVGYQQNIYHGKLSFKHAQQRLDTHYHPYHNLLEMLTTSAQVTYGYSLLVDCHSMPSRFSKNQPAPDFIIGDLHGLSCHQHISETIYTHLDNAGFSVRLNQPYAGGAITRKYHAVQLGLHTVQLEINRGLYMNEETITKTANFKQIQQLLDSLSQKIINIQQQHLIPLQTAAE